MPSPSAPPNGRQEPAGQLTLFDLPGSAEDDPMNEKAAPRWVRENLIAVPDEVWRDETVNLWEWVRPQLTAAAGDEPGGGPR